MIDHRIFESSDDDINGIVDLKISWNRAEINDSRIDAISIAQFVL